MNTTSLELAVYCVVIHIYHFFPDFWDTAGQERFSSMHPSYYHQAHSCLLVSTVSKE